MKTLLSVAFALLLLVACGKKSSDQSSNELTAEQELVVADSLSNDMDQARQELAKETEENLTEIDSLLDNF